MNGQQRAVLQLVVVLARLLNPGTSAFLPVFEDAINKLCQLAGGYLLHTKIRICQLKKNKPKQHVTNIFIACFVDNFVMHYK